MGIMLEDLNSENSQNSPQIRPFKCKKRDEGRPAMSKHEIACIFDFWTPTTRVYITGILQQIVLKTGKMFGKI